MIYENILDLIGNTPVIKINNIDKSVESDIYVKLEKYNLTGSVKDRTVLGLIEKAEKSGKLKKGDIIVEPTSGNTGIALALIGRLKGYKVIIVMPENMSEERKKLIELYGAELLLTPADLGMKGAIDKVNEISKKDKKYFILQQFLNSDNPLQHYETTASEIIKDLPDIDIFIAGVGTGGTIMGIGRKLKEYNENIEIIGVEPYESAVLSGGERGSHKIQGIGAGFIPEIFEFRYIDEIIKVKSEEAINMVKDILEKEGLLLGISSGAVICGALKIAKKREGKKKILVLSADGGEKYLSMDIFGKAVR